MKATMARTSKEYYFYLDNLPSHAYMKWLYKYPQRAFPYQQLIEENRRRNGQGPEYELLDTGSSMMTATSTCLLSTPKETADGHRDTHHGCQPRT
jgi:hypothetical protein